MPKISALTSLAQADVVTTTDVLPIVDATAPATTKKVTVQAMVNAGLATLTTLPSGIVNASLNSITPAGGTLNITGATWQTGAAVTATAGLSSHFTLQSTETAAVGAGPSLMFAGRTGNSAPNYSFGLMRGVKNSAGVDDYTGRMDLLVTTSAGSNTTVQSWTPDGVSVTGSISATATAETFISTAATTSPRSLHLANTGGDVYFGIEGSSSGGFFNGSTAYATVVYSTQRVQTIIIGVKRTEVDSSGLSVTGSINATESITSAGNVIQVGAAGTGTGGNYRITDDGGTLRWLAGLLGTAGARDWTLLEVVSGRTPIRANASTGAVSIDHGLSVTGSISATSLVDISAAGAGQIKFPATQNASADANTLDDYQEATYTGTATGMTTSPTGTVSYTLTGNEATLNLPEITGTSNATTFTVTGMPAEARPASRKTVLGRAQDNGGAIVPVRIDIETTGVLTIYANADAGAFTSSGTKTLAECSVTYTRV